jgi:DNA polymerase III delta subunit
VKFYEFVDKEPKLGPLVVVEGTEEVFAERALARIEERLLDPATKDLNCERFNGPDLDSFEAVASACAAMPFLGAVRLIVVRNVHDVRAAARRALWAVAQKVPAGNTLVVEDLQSPGKRTKPETFGQLAGRAALHVDTTAGADVRARFVREALQALGRSAEPAAVAALANGKASLVAVRTDLEKLSLVSERVTLEDLLRESIVADDVRAYQAAEALVAGHADRALALAAEMIAASNERAVAPALLSAIAAEYRLVWEAVRPGGRVPERFRWREGALRASARRLQEAGARTGYEEAIRGFEALVTGRADDLRAVVAMLAASAASGRERRGAKTTGNR